MENSDIDINLLIDKYEQMRYMNQSIYFDPDEFALLADYYNDFGDVSEADYIVELGLQIHPQHSHLMIVKAKILTGNQKYDEALDCLTAVTDDENDVDLQLTKIECLLNLERISDANDILNYILDENIFIDEDFFTFVSEAGYLYNDINEFEKAVYLLEKARKIDNESYELLIDLSYSYEMLGDLNKAIEINNLLIDLNPYSNDAWINLGKLHSMLEEYDKAIEAYDFALTINEDDINVSKMKALTHYLNDNIEEAISIFKECLKKFPEDETLYDSLLEGYELMEQYDEMLEVIAQKTNLFGKESTLLQRIQVLIKKEMFEDALEEFNKVPVSLQKNFDYYLIEGELALYRDDIECAQNAYLLANIEKPNDEFVIDKLANINLFKNNFEKSAEYLELLLHLNPEYPTAKVRLAFLRFEIGNKEPFDEIMKQFSDEELRVLLSMLGSGTIDYSDNDREKLLNRLNEARENRVLFKNIKY